MRVTVDIPVLPGENAICCDNCEVSHRNPDFAEVYRHPSTRQSAQLYGTATPSFQHHCRHRRWNAQHHLAHRMSCPANRPPIWNALKTVRVLNAVENIPSGDWIEGDPMPPTVHRGNPATVTLIVIGDQPITASVEDNEDVTTTSPTRSPPDASACCASMNASSTFAVEMWYRRGPDTPAHRPHRRRLMRARTDPEFNNGNVLPD